MSLSIAMSNAVSGLAATARGTEVVASNVANAATPGYGRRELMTSASTVTGGVALDGVARQVNLSLLADRRQAQASAGEGSTHAGFWVDLETAIGVAGDGQSLSDRVTAFEQALTFAASRPDNDVRLATVARTAQELVLGVNRAAEALVTARTEADIAIASDVDRLRSALTEVSKLNRQIIIEQANGRDASSLRDARQLQIDGIAAIVPIREIPREGGRIALFTTGGATLLDGPEPADITFERAGTLMPGMSAGTAPVSRLSINGEELSERAQEIFGGGRLAANFAVRDTVAPELQSRLDAFARDLVERFEDDELDTTLTAVAPGLFTDAGSALDVSEELGLANRLRLNALVSPTGDADFWRLRDGLGATAAGDAGASGLLVALAARLGEARATSSTNVAPGSRNIAGFAAELSSHASTQRLASEATSSNRATRLASLDTEMAADGVDTDAEMERLLQLQNAYAANAKVIAAADAMMASLLEMI